MNFDEFILESHACDSSKADEYLNSLTLELAEPAKDVFKKYGATRLKTNSIFISDFETEIELIFGASNNLNFSLSHKIDIFDQRLPKNQLPLAHLAGGDLFTIDASSGKIHLWIHDKDDEYQLRKKRTKLKLVAPSFPALITMIQSRAPISSDPKSSSAWIKVDGQWVKMAKQSP